MAALEDYDWAHNNVRELERCIQRAVALCVDEEQLTRPMFQLGDEEERPVHTKNETRHTVDEHLPATLMDLSYQEAKQRTVERFTRSYIQRRLEEADFNITKAAQKSEMQRPNFSKLMKKFGVDLDSLKRSDD